MTTCERGQEDSTARTVCVPHSHHRGQAGVIFATRRSHAERVVLRNRGVLVGALENAGISTKAAEEPELYSTAQCSEDLNLKSPHNTLLVPQLQQKFFLRYKQCTHCQQVMPEDLQRDKEKTTGTVAHKRGIQAAAGRK